MKQPEPAQSSKARRIAEILRFSIAADTTDSQNLAIGKITGTQSDSDKFGSLDRSDCRKEWDGYCAGRGQTTFRRLDCRKEWDEFAKGG